MLPRFDDQVFTRRDALARGGSDAELARHRDQGRLRTVRPGAYALAPAWDALHAEDRVRWQASAALAASRGAPLIFSHTSAAALWGLPLFRVSPTRVHVTVDGPARSTAQVMRHRIPLSGDDVVWIEPESIGVTGLARTVADLIGLLPREAAVSLADAALRHTVMSDPRAPDPVRAEDLRHDISTLLDQRAGGRGVRAARFVAGFADARAELPGESVSRLFLHQLGFAAPGLQIPVPGPRGHDYRVDFDLDGVWGEFDGAAKYTDPAFLRGRTPERALADEKEREDWIRGTTGRRLVRWQMAHLSAPTALGRHLAAFGIRPPASAHSFRE